MCVNIKKMTERKGRFGWKGLVALTMISGALVFGGVVGCAQTLYTFEGDKKIWDFISEETSGKLVPQSIDDKQRAEGRGIYEHEKNDFNRNNEWSFFAYNEYIDLNNNGGGEINEFLGAGKKVFDLNKEEVHIAIMVPNYMGNVNIGVRDYEGNLVGETNTSAKKNSIVRFPILATTSPGDYIFTATLDNGETKALGITIVK